MRLTHPLQSAMSSRDTTRLSCFTRPDPFRLATDLTLYPRPLPPLLCLRDAGLIRSRTGPRPGDLKRVESLIGTGGPANERQYNVAEIRSNARLSTFCTLCTQLALEPPHAFDIRRLPPSYAQCPPAPTHPCNYLSPIGNRCSLHLLSIMDQAKHYLLERNRQVPSQTFSLPRNLKLKRHFFRSVQVFPILSTHATQAACRLRSKKGELAGVASNKTNSFRVPVSPPRRVSIPFTASPDKTSFRGSE